MLFFWQQIPVIRVTIPFIIGICAAVFTGQVNNTLLWLTLGVLVPVLLIWRLSGKEKKYHSRWVTGCLFFLILFQAGFIYTDFREERQKPEQFSSELKKASLVFFRLQEKPEEKEKSYKAEVTVQGVRAGGKYVSVESKAWVYFQKPVKRESLQYGDLVCAVNNFHPIKPPPNPGQFNFKRFMKFKRIYHLAYFPRGKWKVINTHKEKDLWGYILQMRYTIVGWLKEYLKEEDESAVASALIAGYKPGLTEHLRKSYASTGAMHILAVSGLHVGIIFLVFNFLLNPIGRLKYGNYLKAGSLIMILWFYALLTGLSPSVFRAAAMFSFVVIGQNMKRITNVYGAIFTSMLCLLLWEPFLITRVGFQLSYSAVLGIVFWQPRIYALVPESRWWLIDKIWALTAVSISAQLATFPLALLYFNQFPTYFMISNLVVIPAATIVIYIGFSFLIFKALQFTLLAGKLAFVLDHILSWLNEFIYFISDWPASLIDQVYISNFTCILMYGMVLFISIALIYRNKQFLIAGLLVSSVLVMNVYKIKLDHLATQKVVVFSVQKHTLIGVVTGKEAWLLGDSKILKDEDQLTYNTQRFFGENGRDMEDVKKLVLNDLQEKEIKGDGFYLKGHFFQVKQMRFGIAMPELSDSWSEKPVKLDYVILAGDPDVKLEKLNRLYLTKNYILDSSNAWWNVDEWEKEAMEHKYKAQYTKDKGAIVLSF